VAAARVPRPDHQHRRHALRRIKTIAFFGGSTTWGTGANDESTIPSYCAKSTPTCEAIDFGETGYVGHQNLNLFMRRYLQSFRPDCRRLI
jgi:hypothetical protein